MPKTLSYQINLNCPIGADVRQAVLRISGRSFSRVEAVKALAKELLAIRLKVELYEAFCDRHDAVKPHRDGSSPTWLELQA